MLPSATRTCPDVFVPIVRSSPDIVRSPATVTLPANAAVELATVALGVSVRCVTYVPALLMSLPSVSTPPSAMFSFHSSPASSPSSAANVTASAAPSAAAIRSESVVVSSY